MSCYNLGINYYVKKNNISCGAVDTNVTLQQDSHNHREVSNYGPISSLFLSACSYHVLPLHMYIFFLGISDSPKNLNTLLSQLSGF